MVENDRTVVIDASTAFRVDDDWTYGFPGTFEKCITFLCLYFYRSTRMRTNYHDAILFLHLLICLLGTTLIHNIELSKSQKEQIKSSKRISNPGCYPTGFIALIRPLVDAGIVPADAPLTVNAISGYSGGGNALIDIFEDADQPNEPWGAYGYSMVSVCERKGGDKLHLKRERC